MRLTLRTLLAHEHGLLNEQQAELIAQKIEQSPFVAQLLRHLKDRAARREMVPLGIDARGTVALEKISRYLDYTLPAEEVVKLENECFASDRLLAEVAACHEIISQWLSTPTPTEPALRQRLYAIMPGPGGAISAAEDEIAIDLPALVYDSTPPGKPVPEKKTVQQPNPAAPGWFGGAFRLFAMAASVLALVTFVTMNRDQVESMIAQHWEEKTHAKPELEVAKPAAVNDIAAHAPESQSNPITPIEPVPSVETPPALLPEVATTAFHMPLPLNQSSTNDGSWEVKTAQGTFHQNPHDTAWHTGDLKQLGAGRIVVSPGGRLNMVRQGREIEVRPLSEISLSEEVSVSLRYGSVILGIEPGREMTVDVAGHPVQIVVSHGPLELALSTKPVVSRGLDFTVSTANQEVHFEAVAGEAELSIPGCRGPIPIGPGQMIVAQMNSGVRGSDTSVIHSTPGESSLSQFAKAVQTSPEPIRYLRDSLASDTARQRFDAAMTLTQLGYADAWTSLWSRTHEPETLESYLVHLQQLLAQDSTLASETKAALLQDSQQHGPLVYRLICGFSKDQLTEETRLQLETLLQHPEPAIRCWTHFQLSQR